MDTAENLLHQLFQTVRIISKGLNYCLEPYGLYSSEWSIITTLKQTGPITQGTLASYLNIEPPAVSRSLVKLEKKGFITRTPGMDKREKNVCLSAAALQQYPKWLEISGLHRQVILEALAEDDRNELTRLLKTIHQSAQQYEAGSSIEHS